MDAYKCPICGELSVKNVPPPNGSTSYCLTGIDESNPEKPNFIIGSGLPVQVMGCTKCGLILLGNEKLIGR